MLKYTFQEFTNIAIMRLGKEDINEATARIIAKSVWYKLSSRDIRDVVKVGRLTKSIHDINFVVNILGKLSTVANPK
jgi:Holliday junction DNA helicase RuvB